MTVRDIVDKIECINVLMDLHDCCRIEARHYEQMIDILKDYREDLLNRRVD